MRCVGLLLCLFALGHGLSAYSAEVCNVDGYREIIVQEAKLTYRQIERKQLNTAGPVRTIVVPAVYETMDRTVYDRLPGDMSFEDFICHEIEMGVVSARLHRGEFSNFDIIKRPDGTEFRRPITKMPAYYFDQDTYLKNYVVSEGWKEKVIKNQPRPEPEVLPNGKLRVLMSPAHGWGACLFEANSWVDSFKQRYVYSRTPAIYQQVACE